MFSVHFSRKNQVHNILLTFILIFSVCHTTTTVKRNSTPNLLIIVSDSLRADALNCYGGEANTPHICSLAENGVLFENAYANGPWTLPSSVALFSGNNPGSYIKLRGDFGNGQKDKLFYYINKKEKLLAEALVEKGYEAVYDMETPIPERSNNLQGFKKLRTFKELKTTERAEVENITGIKTKGYTYRTYQRMSGFLHYLINVGEKRFFAVKWMADPHLPYSPPLELIEKIDVDPTQLPRKTEIYPKISYKKIEDLPPLKELTPTMTEYEIYYLKQLYLKEIESVDQRIGYIITVLKRCGLYNNTIIVFTSDHGEGFGEHDFFYHGNSCYNEEIQIPLIFSGPGITRGKRIKEPVSHIDLMPTLKELLEAKCLTNAQGKSYKSLLYIAP